MKFSYLHAISIPMIALSFGAFLTLSAGEEGRLESTVLRENIYPALRSLSGAFTDLKFAARGAEKPKSKVVILEIDEQSIEALGRWPWHRDVMAVLIETLFQHNPRVVGFDITFSEPDERIPSDLKPVLQQAGLGDWIKEYDTDAMLAQTFAKYRDRIVLGWAAQSTCQPAYDSLCPVQHPDIVASIPPLLKKSALLTADARFDPSVTPLLSILNFLPNMIQYDAVSKHNGYFNGFPDPDGVIRRTVLTLQSQGVFYPSLALQMAAVGLEKKIELSLGPDHRIQNLRFQGAEQTLPVSSLGVSEINFRGGRYTFPYVPALSLLSEADTIEYGLNRELASTKTSIFEDAYVLVGISAVAAFDMRSFPFDENTPGVEGHATILDNLLNNDFLHHATSGALFVIMCLLLTVGAFFFAYWIHRLEAIPGLIVVVALIAFFFLADLYLFASQNINMNTALLYFEYGSLFVLMLAAKYIAEEKNKKFIKGAFSKYVAPTVVDSMLDDPEKLTVGGERKEVTILFSDIRSFTTISEKMDPKTLSQFLNDYLSLMTEIIFKHEGTLDKYIGDAVMAFWGAPIAQVDHGVRAHNAALEMLSVLEANRPLFIEKYGVCPEIGIGLNSGTVSVGNMGSERIFEYTVIGDAVNLASRLEGLTKYYGVKLLTCRNLLEHSPKDLRTSFHLRTLDFVKVKGKDQSVEILEIRDKPFERPLLERFAEARALYLNRQWDDASLIFQECANAGDGASRLYQERCHELKLNPPEPSWDGTWKMDSK